MVNAFSQQATAQTVGHAAVERPIFLVGAERSGTALLRLMLDHHSQIAFSSGFDYSVSQIQARGQFPSLPDYYRWLKTDKDFLIEQPTIDRNLTYPELVNSFLQQFRATAGKPIVGAVVHRHFDRLLKLWPDACSIHTVRDGRDVSRSCISMGWAGDGWHGAERWLRAERLWEGLKLQIPQHRRLEVRFEDLILHNTETLDTICRFMGRRCIGDSAYVSNALRYQPEMMDYATGTAYRLPDATLVNQWHRKGSKREIQLIEARIAPLLVERGYVLSGLPHLRVSSAGQIGLKLQNKCGILIRRAQRYGWSLTSADLIARRLGLTGMSDRIRRQINLIDIKTMQQSWQVSDS